MQINPNAYDEKVKEMIAVKSDVNTLDIGTSLGISTITLGKKIVFNRKTKKRVHGPTSPTIRNSPTVHNITRKNSPTIPGRLNEKFIDILDELAKYMVKKGEPFRARAYQKAQETIILYPNEITSENYNELKSYPGIGETIIHKFKEYVMTGTLAVLERERSNPANILAEIYGVGPKKAKELIEKGIKTIDQLRERQDELLNQVQRVGLKYYEDILKRIPRYEIDEYNKIFQREFTTSPLAKYEIVGSYRRGAKLSGDIDVIITSNDKSDFKQFVDRLVETKKIIEVLSRGESKCLVIMKLGSGSKVVARRVDFLYCSPEEYPFSVLYFTGSKIFNTVMRGRALSLGYSLNEHGLHRMSNKQKGAKVDHHFANERAIFAFLKMEYKSPEDRVDGRSVIALPGSPKVERLPAIAVVQLPKPPMNMNADELPTDAADELPTDADELPTDADELPTNAKAKLDAKIDLKLAKEQMKETAKLEKIAKKEAEKIEKEAVKKLEKELKHKDKLEKVAVATRKKRELLIKTVGTKSPKAARKTKKQIKIDANVIKATEGHKVTSKMSNIGIFSGHKTDNPIFTSIHNFRTHGIDVLAGLNEDTLAQMVVVSSDKYYNLTEDDQTVYLTDSEYDILKEYIEQKYPRNQAIAEVGAPITGRNKVQLPYQMPSMDKIKPDSDALASWKRKYHNSCTISCKLDGVSGLYSCEGSSPKLYTRGNGTVGQDISHLIPFLDLPVEKGLVVRGEFIMAKSTFTSKYADKFANARNLVAGAINRLLADDKTRDIDFVAYEIIRPIMKPSDQMAKLLEKRFKTVRNLNKDNAQITNENLSDILLNWRQNYEYEIDGIIVTDDQIHPRATGNPDYAFAFKMAISGQSAETMVTDVVWTASKDGFLKPIVHFNPVSLSGVTIRKATGINGAFIESNRIGLGSIIEIIRSGDVIPKIVKVVLPAERPLMPQVPYKWNETHIDVLLENPENDETVQNKNIAKFFKDIEVEGLGPANVDKIIKAGFDTIPKIIAMSEADFKVVEGFQSKMAKKIHEGIRTQLDKANIVTIMAASNIMGRGFSTKKIAMILEQYPDILVSVEPEQTKIQKLSDIEGMSKKTAGPFIQQIPDFLGFLDECGLHMEKGVKRKVEVGKEGPLANTMIALTEQIDTSHPLYKKTIVFSGGRDKPFETILTKLGANIGSAVSRNTFALITPDTESNTGKVKSARDLGVPIYNLADFREKYIV